MLKISNLITSITTFLLIVQLVGAILMLIIVSFDVTKNGSAKKTENRITKRMPMILGMIMNTTVLLIIINFIISTFLDQYTTVEIWQKMKGAIILYIIIMAIINIWKTFKIRYMKRHQLLSYLSGMIVSEKAVNLMVITSLFFLVIIVRFIIMFFIAIM